MNEPADRATVFYRDGRKETVRNLGWLLSHAGEVHSIVLSRRPNRDAAHGMRAIARDWEYVTDWADWGLALEWVQRPVLDGVAVYEVNDGPTRAYALDHYGQGYRLVGTDVVVEIHGQDMALRPECKPTAPDHALNIGGQQA